MKQKLALARTLLHRPQLIFLDEPTAGLDVVSANMIRDSLASLASREGVTVFLTTHNMAEAERLCSQVAVIRKGNLVTVGNPDVLRAESGGHQVEIVGNGFNHDILEALNSRPEVVSTTTANNHLTIHLNQNTDVAPLVNLMVNQGAQVEEVRKGKATLEEVFLTLMEEER